MGKHLLVDGFNLIRRDTQLSEAERKNFYGAQELLVQRLVQGGSLEDLRGIAFLRDAQQRVAAIPGTAIGSRSGSSAPSSTS